MPAARRLRVRHDEAPAISIAHFSAEVWALLQACARRLGMWLAPRPACRAAVRSKVETRDEMPKEELMFVQIASMIVVSALALPQDSRQPPVQQPPAQGGQPGTAQGDKTRAEQARHKLMLQRADKLIGMRIQDKSQGNVAVIDDMILTPNGQISYAVLSGVEPENQGKLYVVPWSTLTVGATAPPGQPPTPGQPGGMSGSSGTEAERASINVEREKLLKGPSFDRATWTKTSTDREYFSQVDAYYGGSARGDTTGRPMEAGATVGMNAIRGSQLRNQAVVDAQGTTIGNITTVVFDPSGSRINYVALTLSNPNGGGARTIAVPWEALRVSRPQGDPKSDPSGRTAGTTQLTLTTPTDKLQGAPAFETSDTAWRQMSDPKWVNDLYTYYSVRPYWNTASTKDAPEGPDKKPN
jgi:sporulation protein YlmC with PRC-barrel domain